MHCLVLYKAEELRVERLTSFIIKALTGVDGRDPQKENFLYRLIKDKQTQILQATKKKILTSLSRKATDWVY